MVILKVCLHSELPNYLLVCSGLSPMFNIYDGGFSISQSRPRIPSFLKDLSTIPGKWIDEWYSSQISFTVCQEYMISNINEFLRDMQTMSVLMFQGTSWINSRTCMKLFDFVLKISENTQIWNKILFLFCDSKAKKNAHIFPILWLILW